MDQDAIAEMFSAYGSIQLKRMFSGYGLYSEGVCFCMVLRGGEFYFKVDKMSATFVFNNPNQTSACGCGESVAITPATMPA